MGELRDFDVVVCGGGPSGWVAAVSAARTGARTAIIERFGFFGGTATAGLVVPVSGFFKDGKRIVGGIPWEFICNMEEVGAAIVEMPKGHVSVDLEYYKLIAQRMILDAGVHVFMDSFIVDASENGGFIKKVVIQTRGGLEEVQGRIFIDATGDGSLCALAGVPMWVNPEAERQPLSLCFELSNVDCTTDLLKDHIHHDGKAIENSVHKEIHDYLQTESSKRCFKLFGGPWFNTTLGEGSVFVNVTRGNADSLDGEKFSKGEFQLREDMFAIVDAFREKYPEFRKARISSSAVNAGIRESRHLLGAYTLTGQDLIEAREFPDAIAKSGHPMDMHDASSAMQKLIRTEKAGNIPFRCLYNDGFQNLLVAGRLISADSMAYASIRVQATAMATGQAAGVAAALCASRSLCVKETPLREFAGKLLEDD